MAERRRRRRRAEPLEIGAGLERFRRARGRAGAPSGPVGAAAAAWADVVGAPAAAHSVPIRRSRAGVLTVACASAAWAQELASRAEDLTIRLARVCPAAEARTLRFAVADHVPQPPAPRAPAPPPAPPVPSPAERAVGARAAARVSDGRLRDLIARAAAASAARRDGRSEDETPGKGR